MEKVFKKSKLLNLTILAHISVLLIGCQFFYEPQQGPNAVSKPDLSSANVDFGTIYKINPDRQICNESISMDIKSYKGCMLWLGFSGNFNVTVPDSIKNGYGDIENAIQHDRLTITDKKNTVRWYIHMDEIKIKGQFQDPEWSTHPKYIACLGSNVDHSLWSAYAIRITDKSYIKIFRDGLHSQSTPHFWIGDPGAIGGNAIDSGYQENGLADINIIQTFFGTRIVKLTYSIKNSGSLEIRYVDFNQNNIQPAVLKKPKGKETWNAENAMISPDGNWIVYNLYEKLSYYESYYQALRKDSEPTLISKNASDPRWWVHPQDSSLQYIIYAGLEGSYFIKGDLSDPKLSDGSLGRTMKQQIKLFLPGDPIHSSSALIGEPVELAPLPFKGGLSPDGKYLATGYQFAFLLELK